MIHLKFTQDAVRETVEESVWVRGIVTDLAMVVGWAVDIPEPRSKITGPEMDIHNSRVPRIHYCRCTTVYSSSYAHLVQPS